MLVPKGKTIPPPLGIPKRTQHKLESSESRPRPTCCSCLLHNLIRHNANGWTAIKMVFTSPSYMLISKYSVLVEFKTWSEPSCARPGLDMPALWLRDLTDSLIQRREFSWCFMDKGLVWFCLERVQCQKAITHETLYIWSTAPFYIYRCF